MRVTQSDFNAAVFDAQSAVPIGLTGPDGRQAGKRFDIYRNNVAAGLSDALETAFPVLQKLLGERFFRAMAGVYLRRHPPTSPLMMHYGAQMPDFLRDFAPVAHLPYLPDIARVEIAQRRSYHAADAAAIDPGLLGTIPPNQLPAARFRFAPAVQLIQSSFPIYQICSANMALGASRPSDTAATDILLTRSEFDPVLHPLARAASRAVEALMAGQTLGDSVAVGGETCDFGALLGLLLAQHAIVAIT